MPITISPLGPSNTFGPGYEFTVHPEGIPVIDTPWTWDVIFRRSEDQLFLWSQQATDLDGTGARFIVQFTQARSPTQFLADLTVPENTLITMTVELHNNAQLPVTTPLPVQHPWSQVVNLYKSMALIQADTLAKLGTGSGSDQLDRIESAVYQVFPHG